MPYRHLQKVAADVLCENFKRSLPSSTAHLHHELSTAPSKTRPASVQPSHHPATPAAGAPAGAPPLPPRAFLPSAPPAKHPPPPLRATTSSGVEPPVAAPSMPSHIAFEETLVSLVLVGPAASIPQRTKKESAEPIMKALRKVRSGQQVL